jgi:hypothetical protein
MADSAAPSTCCIFSSVTGYIFYTPCNMFYYNGLHLVNWMGVLRGIDCTISIICGACICVTEALQIKLFVFNSLRFPSWIVKIWHAICIKEGRK